jgi:hypothetical protein
LCHITNVTAVRAPHMPRIPADFQTRRHAHVPLRACTHPFTFTHARVHFAPAYMPLRVPSGSAVCVRVLGRCAGMLGRVLACWGVCWGDVLLLPCRACVARVACAMRVARHARHVREADLLGASCNKVWHTAYAHFQRFLTLQGRAKSLSFNNSRGGTRTPDPVINRNRSPLLQYVTLASAAT